MIVATKISLFPLLMSENPHTFGCLCSLHNYTTLFMNCCGLDYQDTHGPCWHQAKIKTHRLCSVTGKDWNLEGTLQGTVQGHKQRKFTKEEYFPEGRWAIAGERSEAECSRYPAHWDLPILFMQCALLSMLKLHLGWAFPGFFSWVVFITFLIFTNLYNARHMLKLYSSATALLSNLVDTGIIDICMFISPCLNCLSSSPAKQETTLSISMGI